MDNYQDAMDNMKYDAEARLEEAESKNDASQKAQPSMPIYVRELAPNGLTAERHEQIQNETNKKREEYLASLSPELREKFVKIHRAASILDEAKIPFFLAARPDENLPPIQYYEFSYQERFSDKDFEVSRKNAKEIYETCALVVSTWFQDFIFAVLYKDSSLVETIYRGAIYRGEGRRVFTGPKAGEVREEDKKADLAGGI